MIGKYNNYKAKTLAEQKQIIANKATVGIRLMQLISISTVSGFVVSWILIQLGYSPAHAMYWWIFGFGFLAGAALAVTLEDQIEQYTEAIGLFILEKQWKSFSFLWVFVCLIGFLAVSIGLSMAGKKDIAHQANHYEGKQIDHTINGILNTAKDSSPDSIIAMKNREIAQINKEYEDLKATSKKQAKTAKTTADKTWLKVGNIKDLEKKRIKAIAKISKLYDEQLQTVKKASTANISQAFSLVASIEQNRVKEDSLLRKKADDNIKRHEGLMGNAILVSAPLTLLLIFLRVTILFNTSNNSNNSNNKKGGSGQKPSPIPPRATQKTLKEIVRNHLQQQKNIL